MTWLRCCSWLVAVGRAWTVGDVLQQAVRLHPLDDGVARRASGDWLLRACGTEDRQGSCPVRADGCCFVWVGHSRAHHTKRHASILALTIIAAAGTAILTCCFHGWLLACALLTYISRVPSFMTVYTGVVCVRGHCMWRMPCRTSIPSFTRRSFCTYLKRFFCIRCSHGSCNCVQCAMGKLGAAVSWNQGGARCMHGHGCATKLMLHCRHAG